MLEKRKLLKKFLATSLAVGVLAAPIAVGMTFYTKLYDENDKIYAKYNSDYEVFNKEYVANRTEALKQQLFNGEISQSAYNAQTDALQTFGFGKYNYVKVYGDPNDATLISSNARRADNNITIGMSTSAAFVTLGLFGYLFKDIDKSSGNKQQKGQNADSSKNELENSQENLVQNIQTAEKGI